MSDKMSLLDTVAPKSDQLNYDDLIAGPIRVKVTGLASGTPDQPVHVRVASVPDGKPRRDYKPCKSMRRVLIAAWGDKGKDWIGKEMVLYGDDTVAFGGVKVGGIRISHVSGIAEPLRLKLTTTRSKRSDYVVLPIPKLTLDAPSASVRSEEAP